MILTSFQDIPKSSVSPAKEFWLIGLPIVAGVTALIMSLISVLLAGTGAAPEARIVSLTDQNHLLLGMTVGLSILLIVLALQNKHSLKQRDAEASR
jgi:hypothetical protein